MAEPAFPAGDPSLATGWPGWPSAGFHLGVCRTDRIRCWPRRRPAGAAGFHPIRQQLHHSRGCNHRLADRRSAVSRRRGQSGCRRPRRGPTALDGNGRGSAGLVARRQHRRRHDPAIARGTRSALRVSMGGRPPSSTVAVLSCIPATGSCWRGPQAAANPP